MTFNSGATSGPFALETATGCNPFSKWKKLSKVVEGAQCVLGNSFVAGTLVHTDQGLKPIEEVKVGEKVKSFNERTGQTSYQPVMELMQHDGTFQLVKVTLDSGESLEATAGHPFYIQGKGWNVAATLKVGDALRLHNGITLVVKTVETSTYVGRVYNFAVAQNANYFVGMDGVLVHNSGGCPGLKGDPYHPDGVADRIKPPYRPNPAHNKKSSSYNPRKTPEPDDADSVYQNATRKDNMGTWYGKNDKGQTYKYYYDNAGGAHFIGIE